MARLVNILSDSAVARLQELSEADRRLPRQTLGQDPGVPPALAARYDVFPFINRSGATIPAFGLFYIGTADEQYNIVQGLYPPTYGVVSLGIYCGLVSLPDDRPGFAWPVGDCIPRQVLVQDYAGLAVGDRIGPDKASFSALANPLGPLTILRKLTSPYVLALPHGRRGDQIYFDTGDADTTGPAYYVELGIGYDLSDSVAPGVPGAPAWS